MPKQGRDKNTKNKAKHTKLLNRKLNKIRKDKDANKARLKEINRLFREQNTKNPETE